MLLIYEPKITGRCKYIFHLVFKDILGMDFEIVSDIDYFKSYKYEKFSYALQPVSDEIFIQSHKLLFETGINDQDIQVFEWNGNKVLTEQVKIPVCLLIHLPQPFFLFPGTKNICLTSAINMIVITPTKV